MTQCHHRITRRDSQHYNGLCPYLRTPSVMPLGSLPRRLVFKRSAGKRSTARAAGLSSWPVTRSAPSATPAVGRALSAGLASAPSLTTASAAHQPPRRSGRHSTKPCTGMTIQPSALRSAPGSPLAWRRTIPARLTPNSGPSTRSRCGGASSPHPLGSKTPWRSCSPTLPSSTESQATMSTSPTLRHVSWYRSTGAGGTHASSAIPAHPAGLGSTQLSVPTPRCAPISPMRSGCSLKSGSTPSVTIPQES